MDETKRAEARVLLDMLRVLVPDAKSFAQLEAEAVEAGADLRSYCYGYFQGLKEGCELAARVATPRQPKPPVCDITNLWGLLP